MKMRRDAIISECGKYRYALSRRWDAYDNWPSGFNSQIAMFIMLNPSTADALEDDPTIRRCIGFAKEWDCNGIVVGNLFAYRATNPRDLKSAKDPIGEFNDSYLIDMYNDSRVKCVVTAWGTHGSFLERDQDVMDMFQNLQHLGLTKNGCPKHPLYLPKNTKPIRWSC